jgi:hypothetical protein
MKTNLILLSVFITILVYANINRMDGISGMTRKDGGSGCQCHNFISNDSVKVWISGPDTLYSGDSAAYKIFMTGGPAVVGGFDLAVFFGILNEVDTLAKIKDGDLVHSFPKLFINDTVVWDFKYIAPDTVLADTLYATGNSCNGDSIPTEIDQWNHAENFIVNVVDEPVYVEDGSLQPDEFILYQNYPNPFNPSTRIRFTIPQDVRGETRDVTLKVYDILGNEVATLVNEEKSAGTYKVEFDASALPSGISAKGGYASGVYFYQLKIGGSDINSGQAIIQTKKMLLVK